MATKKTTTSYPLPYQKGNTVISKYEESFIDRIGNKATLIKVDFTDKKQKSHKGYVLFVKWG